METQQFNLKLCNFPAPLEEAQDLQAFIGS